MTSPTISSPGPAAEINPSKGSGKLTLTGLLMGVAVTALLFEEVNKAVVMIGNMPRIRAGLIQKQWQNRANQTKVVIPLALASEESQNQVLTVKFFDAFTGDVSSLSPEYQDEVKTKQSHLIFYQSGYDGGNIKEVSVETADDLLQHNWAPLIHAAEEAKKINPKAVSPDAIKAVVPTNSASSITQVMRGAQLAFLRNR